MFLTAQRDRVVPLTVRSLWAIRPLSLDHLSALKNGLPERRVRYQIDRTRTEVQPNKRRGIGRAMLLEQLERIMPKTLASETDASSIISIVLVNSSSAVKAVVDLTGHPDLSGHRKDPFSVVAEPDNLDTAIARVWTQPNPVEQPSWDNSASATKAVALHSKAKRTSSL